MSPPLSAVLWDAQAMMTINRSTVEVELSFSTTTKGEKKFIKAAVKWSNDVVMNSNEGKPIRGKQYQSMEPVEPILNFKEKEDYFIRIMSWLVNYLQNIKY